MIARRSTANTWTARRAIWVILFGIALAALILILLPGEVFVAPSTGSGGVFVGDGPPALVINQTSVMADLYPGLPPQALSGTFTNPGQAPVRIGSVTAALSGITEATGACALDNFELVDPVMAVGGEIPVGEDVGTWGGATIRMLDTAQNQDGCRRARVQISYTAR